MKKYFIFILAAILLLGSGCYGGGNEEHNEESTAVTENQNEAALSKIADSSTNKNEADIDENNESLKLLIKTDLFTYNPISANGHITDEIKAYYQLFKEDNAKNYFHKLESEGSAVGRLYGLCGLYYLDNSYYNEVLEEYMKLDKKISCIDGCISFEPTVSEMIKRDGAVKLNGIDDTVYDWSVRNNSPSSSLVDFAGGGIPYTIRECSERFLDDHTYIKPDPPIELKYNSENIDENNKDLKLLMNADYFLDYFTYEPEKPDTIIAWNNLMNDENALDYFIKLEQEATFEGRMYGLCGLYFFDKDYYDQQFNIYSEMEGEITYMSSSMKYELSLSDFILKHTDFKFGTAPKNVNAYAKQNDSDTSSQTSDTPSYNSDSIDENNKDLKRLMNPDFFANGAVSEGAIKPDEIKSWYNLLNEENALDYFLKLEQEATLEGKMYGLCGLFFFNRDYYNQQLKMYSEMDDEITYMGGCLVTEIPLTEFLSNHTDFESGSTPEHLKAYAKQPEFNWEMT